LFPSRNGGLQSSSTLQKPFEHVSAAMKKATNGKFQKRITPMGMRRTNKDLLRAAGVRDIVAMAIKQPPRRPHACPLLDRQPVHSSG